MTAENKVHALTRGLQLLEISADATSETIRFVLLHHNAPVYNAKIDSPGSISLHDLDWVTWRGSHCL